MWVADLTCTLYLHFTRVQAGVFVLGVGTGVTMDSAINTDPKDLASRDAIDQVRRPKIEAIFDTVAYGGNVCVRVVMIKLA